MICISCFSSISGKKGNRGWLNVHFIQQIAKYFPCSKSYVPSAICVLNPTGKSKLNLFSKVPRQNTYNKILIDKLYRINLDTAPPYSSSVTRKESGNGAVFVAGGNREEQPGGTASPSPCPAICPVCPRSSYIRNLWLQATEIPLQLD